MVTNMLRLWKHRVSGLRRPRPLRQPVRRQGSLSLEALEDRLVPAMFLVANLNDAGAGSLRQAILDANANPGADTINFQSGLTGTIALKSGQLAVTDALTINGPGASALTLSGNNSSRVFNIDNGTATLPQPFAVSINGLSLTAGSAPSDLGGALRNQAQLMLSNVVVSGNAALAGAGIYNKGTLALTDCTVANNTTSAASLSDGSGGLVSYAVAAGIASSGSLSLVRTTVSGNTISVTAAAPTGSAALAAAAGIASTGPLTLTQSSVSNNKVTSATVSAGDGASIAGGAGIACFNTTTLTDSSVSNNEVVTFGLIEASKGVSFAGAVGGGLVCVGPLTITRSTVSGNKVTAATVSAGGGVAIASGAGIACIGAMTLNDSSVSHNEVTAINLIGGGAFTGAAGGGLISFTTASLTRCTVSGNTLLSISDTLGDSTAIAAGGGLANAGHVTADGVDYFGQMTLDSCDVSGNKTGAMTAGRGLSGAICGGLYNAGQMALTNCSVTGNQVVAAVYGSGRTLAGGGGLGNAPQATLTLTRSTVANNTTLAVFQSSYGSTGVAYAGGGGIDNAGQLTLTYCSVAYNSASVDASPTTPEDQLKSLAYGGGILNETGGTAVIEASLLNGNSAGSLGGGLANAGTLAVFNSTLVYNSAGITGLSGAALFNDIPGKATVTNCTISYNLSVGHAGDILGSVQNFGALTLNNTIVANSYGQDVLNSGTLSGSHNLIETGSGLGSLSGTLTADPHLGGLRDYGGPVPTMAPHFDSPALGAGDPSLAVDANGKPLAYDERGPGYARVIGGRVDIGAVQDQVHGPLNLVVNDPGDRPLTFDSAIDPAHLTLREAVHLANANYFTADTITFALPAGTTITLTQGMMNVEETGTITGPGADRLTVSGGKASQIFHFIDFDDNSVSSYTVSGLKLTAGSGDIGGAIRMEGILLSGGLDALNLTTVALVGNTANFGGAIAATGVLTMTGCTLTGNSAKFGGAVDLLGGYLTMTGCTLTGNSATAYGGAIEYVGITATITDSTITANTAGGGGGIYAGGTFTLTNSTVSGNSAAQGGGLLILSPTLTERTTITNCTIAGNSASIDSAGILTRSNLVLVNTTLSGNTAAGQGVPSGQAFGVGLVNYYTATLINCTVADNISTVPGGCTFLNDGIDTVDVGSGTLTLNNTIVAGGGAKVVNVNGGVVKGSHNLIQGESPAGLTGTLTANPLLAPLGGYGGATQTRALLPGSPALGAGDPALAVDRNGQPLATDQRGLPRLNKGTVDLGAFESRGFTLTRAGDNQSTVINTAFAQPLQVTVTANDPGVPVAGGALTFSAPTVGASAALGATSVSVPASGVVSTTATANGYFGRYQVTASAGASSTTAFTLTNQLVLSATGVNISATAGAPFSGMVATFRNPDPSLDAASYRAVIDWGDGSTSPGVVAPSNLGPNTMVVTGSHTYADPGNKTVRVTISYSLGYTTTATTTATATVTGLGQGVVKGLTGGIGFWHNKNGQKLITSFNGGATATTLANWLAATFPNLYGATAGANNLTGKTNAQVAAYFQVLFSLGGSKVQAEVLAVALNVYATTSLLGGNAGVAYGFTVSATGLGARSYNVGKDGAAFGVADNSMLNVYQLLLAVNNKAANGVLYNGDAVLQAQAADLFDALNNAGGIG